MLFMKRSMGPIHAYRRLTFGVAARYASSKPPQTDKSRILEKPARFNPPSHGARRVKRRLYPGPKLTGEEQEAQATKRYPNMMPPEGSLAHWLITSRGVHLWITLGVLTSLAVYSITLSFVNNTAFRDDLPSKNDFTSHPIQSVKQWVHIYRLHIQHESEIVAEKRRKKLEDAEKRKEFMRAHGVEPGFLTGSWMERFGTVEGDAAREAMRKRIDEKKAAEAGVVDHQSPIAVQERPKKKVWLGIW